MTDHDLTDATHRDACPACAGEWAALEGIAAEARALPVLTPSRDLWGGIEARLGDRPGELRDPSAPLRRRARWWGAPAVRLAAAASLLVAATATITWQVATRDGASTALGDALPIAASTGAPTDAPGAANRGSAAPLAAGTSARPVADGGFRSLDAEIRALEAVLRTQSRQLDPVTRGVLERNLAVIDAAIAESRAALAQDPASRFLTTQLARSYSAKLALLRDATTLGAGT
jgi:hypothetical protein